MESIIKVKGRKQSKVPTPQTKVFCELSSYIKGVFTIEIVQKICDFNNWEIDLLGELTYNHDIAFSTDTPECNNFITTKI